MKITAEFASWALCSDGANISAEVLQLSHVHQGLLTLPEQIRNHSGLCPPACSFFSLVSALLFLCFGFLHVLCESCTPWTCPETDTCESLCATTCSLLGCWPSSSLQIITTGFTSAGTPHTCTRMVTEPAEHFCSLSHRFPSFAVPQCVSACGIAQVVWVGEAVPMSLSADTSKAALYVRNQMAVM